MSSVLRVALVGAAGRMGKAIQEVLEKNPGTTLSAAIVEANDPMNGKPVLFGDGVYTSSLEDALGKSDVGIDFSEVSSALETVEAFSRSGRPLVIGTTGFSAKEKERIYQAGERIPLILSPNMSLGIHLLSYLVKIAAEKLPSYDAEIVETHHRMKKDAPSGTALFLGESLASARGKRLGDVGTYHREGMTGVRPQDSIGIMALRGGDVVGDHTVFFLGEGERLELTHRATSRETFARGAVEAAVFLARKKTPGVYTMTDVLGLESEQK
ncbi:MULTISPECIES: 4-hydroxy-tetrahydrodipicolinate reductase [Leptospirillum]|uniref:4-hydroxy-tetrahydrodipicolinate reductase n=1 Tax=Leptospirillum ferriphilum (strain ML-04) TaxID=1048260 RepID=J9ZDL3_LEPFM|nr:MULTISPECIES: 4-hydroxy-tetrahydrodipicolinate reductase [Leptospirillum]AFS54504.1 dihydrodipicolinate reductase [Leptospirillum ferriphilum ML-04]